MVRKVVSVLRSGPASARASDPVLEANAYAVAEDVDLVLVLRGDGVELALVAGETTPASLGGVPLPPAASGQDLRGLVESGVAVFAASEDLERAGLSAADLVEGVEIADFPRLAGLLHDADAVLNW